MQAKFTDSFTDQREHSTTPRPPSSASLSSTPLSSFAPRITPTRASIPLPSVLPHPQPQTSAQDVPLPLQHKSQEFLPSRYQVVHELYPSASSSIPLGRAQNYPENTRNRYLPLYMSGNASRTRPPNMSDLRPSTSSPDQARPGSRGRSHSQSVNPSRRPPNRQAFQPIPTAPLYPLALPSPSVDNMQTSSAPSPSYQGIPTPYQAASLPYGQRGAFVGQYTMSPPPPVNMPQYAYPHHPGLHATDTSMHPPQNQLLGYSTNTPMPMIQPHTPVYQGYPGHSPDGSSSSNPSHSFTGPGHSALFSHSAHSSAHPSPPPHTPLNQQGSGQHPQSLPHPQSAPYASQGTYPPLRYSTPPFAYPSHSFAPSPSIYATSYAPSPYAHHSYAPEPGQETTGIWWYLPPAHQASSQYESFQNPYSMSFNLPPREIEAYSQPGPSAVPSPMYPMSPTMNTAQQYPTSQQPPLMLPEQQPPIPSPVTTSPSEPYSVPRQKPPGRSASVSPSNRSATERSQPHRRAHHSSAPAQRSEWVMWVGNVPSDTSHDELWRFLNQPPAPNPAVASTSAAGAEDVWGGVLSIHLISRSNCAFVNFQTEGHLLNAIRHFNGQPLRPVDPRCPRLVCRVRGRDDDRKAGVGGQRGTGLHIRYVKDQKEKARQAALAAGFRQDVRSPTASEHVTISSSSPSETTPILAHLSLSSDDEGGRRRRSRRPEPHSSSSGSYASTNSGFLKQNFSKRYFILKSLTQKDLDLSVEKGLWATQQHNEDTLNRAFRTSKEVYLIFGVNKSGEFYGYARMVGPIMRGEHRVPWSSRDSPPTRRASRSSQTSSPTVPRQDPPTFFSSAEHRYEESPQPVSPDPPQLPSQLQPHAGLQQQLQAYDGGVTPRTVDVSGRHHASAPHYKSAPPEVHQVHHRLSNASRPVSSQTFDTVRQVPPLQGSFQLDPNAPARNMREHSAPPEASTAARDPEFSRRSERDSIPEAPLDPVAEEDDKPADAKTDTHQDRSGEAEIKESPPWGDSFKVQWIRTERLPFHRTRHLRNPWNHDREIKVSRDGTELEPSVGQALLEEWDRPAPPAPVPLAADRRQGSKMPAAEGSAGPAAVSQEQPQREGG